MKYKNRNDYGKKIRLGNEEVEISKIGELVHKEEKRAKELVKEFADFFYDENAKPKKIKDAKNTSELDSIYQEKIEYFKRIISQQKEELVEKDKAINMFRELAVKAENKLKVDKGADAVGSISLGEKVIVEKKEEDSTQILGGKTLAQLKEICVEMNLPKEEWSKLKKEDLVKYLNK